MRQTPHSVAASADIGRIPVIQPSARDDLLLAEGLDYRMLISWSDPINNRGERFGFNNDFIAHVPVDKHENDLLLWVNHENIVNGYFMTPSRPEIKTREDVILECSEVGGSILHIRKHDGHWQVLKNDPYNRRIDATTEIPIIADRAILGTTIARGTLANCAGGVTPWNTILSCEENYEQLVGEVDLRGGERAISQSSQSGWERFLDMPPEHYGWVVEVNPFNARAKKLTSMGRFAHESATVMVAHDSRCVVYSGDDKTDECLYKFIAHEPGDLDNGTLYVADTGRGKWLPLDIRQDPRLAGHFTDQVDLLIRTREAAHLVGGTRLDRPEDIKRDPVSGAIYIALTKNSGKGRPYGSIIKLIEKDNDPLSLEFSSSVFLSGGMETGFACPDILAFDRNGNLWFTSDIAGNQLNHPPYTTFKNNGLFFVPLHGDDAGRIHQLASAPVHAELTGLCFSPDGRELFLSVQHPGEYSRDAQHLASHWPDGGLSLPKPSVVVISGGFLDA